MGVGDSMKRVDMADVHGVGFEVRGGSLRLGPFIRTR